MAEIDIQRKRTPMWPWILGIIVAVVLIVFLVAGRDRPSEMPYGGGPEGQPGEQSQPAGEGEGQFESYNPAEEPGVAPPGGRHPVNPPTRDAPGTGGGPGEGMPEEGASPQGSEPGADERPAGSIRTDATSGEGAAGRAVTAQVAGGGEAPDHLTQEYPRQGTTEDRLPAAGIVDEEHPAPGVPRETRPDLDRPIGTEPDEAGDEQGDVPDDGQQDMQDGEQGDVPDEVERMQEDAEEELDEMQEGAEEELDEMQEGAEEELDEMQEGAEDELDELQEGAEDEFDEGRDDLQDEFDEGRDDVQDEFDEGRDDVQDEFNPRRDDVQRNPNDMSSDLPGTIAEAGDELEVPGGGLDGVQPFMAPGGVYPIPVQSFVQYVEDGDTRRGGYDQEYTGDGIRELADALYELAAHATGAADDAEQRRDRMTELADRLQTSESGEEARPVYQAFVEAAEWMNLLQQTRYPQVGDQVQAVREAAQGVNPDGQLREQREAIQAFFHRSQEAIEAMGQAAGDDHPDLEP